MTVLISDSDQGWSAKLFKCFSDQSIQTVVATNAKDCQLKLSKGKYEAIILDVNEGGFELLKHVRINYPHVKVLLTFPNKEKLLGLELSKDDLLKLGVAHLLIKPYNVELLMRALNGENQFLAWRKNTELKEEGETQNVGDEEFRPIKVDTLFSGNTAIFDLYIKLAPNKYVKVLLQGDSLTSSQLSKYVEQKLVSLYYKDSERMSYTAFIDQLMLKSGVLGREETIQKVKALKNASESYIEEIYTKGIDSKTVDEGKALCQRMHDLILKDKALSDVLRVYEDYDRPAYAHLFLTSFLSIIMSKNFDWSSERTLEMTAMGGLLHDIGMTKLPDEICNMNVKDMDREQLALYQTHPQLGVEMLQQAPIPVKQIVYQHHEWINGEGFPNGLSATKIYPMAKVVAVADEFSSLLITKQLTPLAGIKEFITNQEVIQRYDPGCLRALVKAFFKDVK